MAFRNGRKPDHKVNIGVGKDNINDFARKYNLEIEDIYDALNQDTAKKIVFYKTSDYWSSVPGGGYKLSIPHNGNIVFAVYRTDSATESTQVLTGVSMDSTNVNIESEAKFSGYMLCGTMKDEVKHLDISEDGTYWDAEEFPVRNIGGPQKITDAATKDYVDRILAGYSGHGERLAIFDNVSQMQEAELVPSQVAVTYGYWDINDGGRGVYNIRAKQASDIYTEIVGGTAVDVVGDDGSVIAIGDKYDVDNVLYVAELIIDGTVNVKQFGAKGDGVAVDDAAFQNIATYASAKNLIMLVPPATYKVTTTITGTFGTFGDVTITGGGTVDIVNLKDVADDAQDSADAAATSESNALSYRDAAQTSESNALSHRNAAQTSAAAAAASASEADTTATALTTWLQDKETLTAPAVDSSFTIGGAAADAKRVGALANAFAFVHGTSRLDLRRDDNGTTIYIKPCAFAAMVPKYDGTLGWKQISLSSELAVPHDSFAVFDYDDSSVKTISYSAVQNFKKGFILFYNSNGNVRGVMEVSHLETQLPLTEGVYFYGKLRPSFSVGADKAVTVTIPANGRINLTLRNGSFRWRESGFVVNFPQTITVPHDKCLVYNIRTKNVSVENTEVPFSEYDYVLFYNSFGGINGPWREYYLEQRLDGIAERSSDLPSYYDSYVPTKAKSICSKLTNGNSSAIVFITDIHYPENTMISPSLVDAICKQTNINKVFLGGDDINRETEKNNALRQINRINSAYRYPSVKTFTVVGNHEFNNPGASPDPDIVANQLSATDLRFTILNSFLDRVTYDTNTLSYYYDDVDAKIRYIVCSVTYTSGVDINSIKWCCSKLLTVPADYHVVVLCHTIISTNYETGVHSVTGSRLYLTNALDAYKQRQSYTLDGSTYDFTNANGTLICAICGDGHIDADYTTAAGVLIIETTSDNGPQAEDDYDRTAETTNEQAFDVYIFDKTNFKIHIVRVGAGNDREFDFS